MSEETIGLSKRENLRAQVLSEAERQGRVNGDIARALGLSIRQVQRLKKALREKGPTGIAHGNRGRRAAHSLPEELRLLVADLYGSTYAGFNFTHFHEKLVEVEGIVVGFSSVKRILHGAGYTSPKKRRPTKHRSRRERRSHEGAMLQLDGSPHDWLEGRGPRMCLVGAIDDATSKVVGALFRSFEDSQGYFLVFRGIVRKYGIPETIYRDRHGIFERDPKEEEELWEQLAGKREPTQFGRLMKELGIEQIAANSPQAKGRIERLWGTFQDRLVSELRLVKASTLEEANHVLGRAIVEHNRRFCRKPGDPQPVYRKLPPRMDLDALFCFKYRRTVAKDNTVSFFGHIVDIEPGPEGRSYAGCVVEIQERFDGSLHLLYQGRRIAKTNPLATPPAVMRVRNRIGRYTQECPWTAPKQLDEKQISAAGIEAKPKGSSKPGPNHPWRRAWVT